MFLYICTYERGTNLEYQNGHQMWSRVIFKTKSETIFLFISFTRECRRSDFRPSCDVVDDVITIKNFFCIMRDVLFIDYIKLKLRLLFFLNSRHFEVAFFFTRRDTGNSIYQYINHTYFQHWELFNDVLAKISTGLKQSKLFKSFVTQWRHQYNFISTK